MKRIIPIIIIAASFLLSILFYPQFPEKMASHWGLSGEVNGYMNKFWGSFFMPILSVGLYLLFLIIPKIDPKAKNIEKFKTYYDNFIILFVGFLSYLHILTLVWNLGYQFNLLIYLTPAFTVFFYYIGVLIEKAEPNWTIGVRTPWTLSNDKVWEKTHHLVGKLFKAISILTLLGVIFPSAAMIMIITGAIGISIFSFIYSYLEYKKITS